MSVPVPSLDAIPLPGETAGEQKSERKRSKLRRLQDSSQPSGIIVTKVVTTKTSSHTTPASKLKMLDDKQRSLPTAATFPPLTSARNQSTSTVSNLPNYPSSCFSQSSSGTKSLSLPASQTIVDELFKDFLASKQKEEQSTLDQHDPDIVSSMEEMSKLLDEEISMINGNTISQNQRKKKGRWDCEEKKSSVNAIGEKSNSESKKGRWDCESRKEVISRGPEVEKDDDDDDDDDDDKLNGGKATVGGIKLEISKQSRDWINSGDMMDQKKKVVLEEGEVLSSSSEDSDEESEDSEVVEEGLVETGSLSHSDKEGKTKSKKKKKHKHKHKKKKKHKSGKGERKNSKEKSFKDDRKEGKKDSKKEKSEEGKKKDEKKERKKEDKKDHKSKNSEKRRHSRSRSKSPKRRRTRSRTRSKERHRDRTDEWETRSYGGLGHPRSDRHHRRSRSRSRSRDRSRSRSRERSHEKSRRRDRDERHHDREHRHRDRERGGERERIKDGDREKDLRVKIDKSKLRKIAIANVLAAVKAGEQGADVDLATLKAGGKSVEELTDFCKKISEKGYSDSDSDSEYGRHSDGEEGEGPFINHPFKLRDPSTLPNIIMNIRNSKQLPVLTPQAKATQCAQLRLQFPVSSGSQHRAKEDQWVPVEKTTAPMTATIATPVVATPATPAALVPAPVSHIATVSGPMNVVAQQDKVFPDPPAEPIDIGAIVSERLSLVRKLTENPYDVQALCSMHKAQEKSSQWAQSKFLPGQFTGSTGVQPLTQQELAGPDKKNQAWFKKGSGLTKHRRVG
ncbi:protein Son-like isoform X2 [Haliotis asinina]|uniref:protein Son-like isoform X2 n=1 Tax=Haliotis asinina TaxID=109174 RepID=UPI0035325627